MRGMEERTSGLRLDSYYALRLVVSIISVVSLVNQKKVENVCNYKALLFVNWTEP